MQPNTAEANKDGLVYAMSLQYWHRFEGALKFGQINTPEQDAAGQVRRVIEVQAISVRIDDAFVQKHLRKIWVCSLTRDILNSFVKYVSDTQYALFSRADISDCKLHVW